MVNATSTSSPADRRGHRRRAVLLQGRLFRGPQRFDCLVSDLSATGAKLKVTGPVEAEHIATLEIGRCGMVPGTVVWRDGDRLGFRFFEPPQRVAELIGTAYPTVLGTEARPH